MRGSPYFVTVAGFMTGPQEVVLGIRHGRIDEDPDSYRRTKNDIYRLLESSLGERHLGQRSVSLSYRGLSFRLALKRFYHHEGGLCRFVYLNVRAADPRPNGPTMLERDLMLCAGWVAGYAFCTAPRFLRIIYVFLVETEAGTQVAGIRAVNIAPVSELEATERVRTRLNKIVESMALSDAQLPECSIEERHGYPGNEYLKCRDHCRVRTWCKQYEKQRLALTQFELSPGVEDQS